MMGGYGQGVGWGMMGGWGLWGWLAMLLFGALVIAGIVLLVIWAVRVATGDGQHRSSSESSRSHSAPSPAQDEAISIARKRLASGDITPEQYEEIVRALGTGG